MSGTITNPPPTPISAASTPASTPRIIGTSTEISISDFGNPIRIGSASSHVRRGRGWKRRSDM